MYRAHVLTMRKCYPEAFFRNLVPVSPSCHTWPVMPETPETATLPPADGDAAAPATSPVRKPTASPARDEGRPFRVKLRGSVLALVRLPNRREVRGKLHQLSVTGGLVNLEKTLDEKLEVELIFHLGQTTIREKAQMMFPMWATQGWLQPFRFVDLPEAHRDDLEKNLLQLVQGSQEPAI
jgi:hypothetical protein